MKKKLINYVLLISIALSLTSCGSNNQKKQIEISESSEGIDNDTEQLEKPTTREIIYSYEDSLNMPYYAYASAPEGYLPLVLHSESNNLFVHYVKNGKLLDKIPIVYRYTIKDNDKTMLVFDEMINNKKHGVYHISKRLFYSTSERVYEASRGLIKYFHNEKEIWFQTDWYISRFHSQIQKNRTEDASSDDDFDEYAIRATKTVDLLYQILSTQKDIENFHEIDPWTRRFVSDDKKLSIYITWQDAFPRLSFYDIFFYYKDAGVGSVFANIDPYSPLSMNYPFLHEVLIHTIQLNNSTHYLVEYEFEDARGVEFGFTNIVELYTIQDGELIQKKAFHNGPEIREHLKIIYNEKDKYVPNENAPRVKFKGLFKYDKKSKSLYIPIVENYRIIPDRYQTYQYDDEERCFKIK